MPNATTTAARAEDIRVARIEMSSLRKHLRGFLEVGHPIIARRYGKCLGIVVPLNLPYHLDSVQRRRAIRRAQKAFAAALAALED